MNIVFATTEFLTEHNDGGYGRYVENIASIFSEKGHRVFVVVLSNKDEDFTWRNGITVCRVKLQSNPTPKGLLVVPIFIGVVRSIWGIFERSYVIKKKIKKINDEFGVDIIQTTNLREINLCRCKNIPTIVRISGNNILCDPAMEYDYDYLTARRRKLHLTKELSNRALKKADYVFASSNIAATEIGERYGVNISVIETPYKNDIVPSYSLYEQYLVGKKYFLFFSNLNFLKGIRALSECLDVFLEDNKDIYFVFCGLSCEVSIRGEVIGAWDYIKGMCNTNCNRLIFLDRVWEKNTLFGIVENAEACVMPSRVDNLPNTCIEAMSLGKIVIGTDGASFEQMIEDGYNGLLCKIDDSSSLLEKMNYAARMTLGEKRIMGERAKKTIERMSADKIYDKLIKLYIDIIERKRNTKSLWR